LRSASALKIVAYRSIRSRWISPNAPRPKLAIANACVGDSKRASAPGRASSGDF